MFEFIGLVVVFALGYTASIFTWPWLRLKWNGVENEYDRIKAALDKLKVR